MYKSKSLNWKDSWGHENTWGRHDRGPAGCCKYIQRNSYSSCSKFCTELPISNDTSFDYLLYIVSFNYIRNFLDICSLEEGIQMLVKNITNTIFCVSNCSLHYTSGYCALLCNLLLHNQKFGRGIWIHIYIPCILSSHKHYENRLVCLKYKKNYFTWVKDIFVVQRWIGRIRGGRSSLEVT